MWELYAFWAFVPVLLNLYNQLHHSQLDVSIWSFIIIAAGSLGCVFGGYGSLKLGSGRIAFAFLLISGLCCLLSPLIFGWSSSLFLAILFLWGFTVVGDSPQFSTLVARTAPSEYIGTALTIVNCIGFALTIVSIQMLNYLQQVLASQWLFLFLLPGPILGLWAIRHLLRVQK